jgi:hypothetical protein
MPPEVRGGRQAGRDRRRHGGGAAPLQKPGSILERLQLEGVAQQLGKIAILGT